jgi:restriction system protein
MALNASRNERFCNKTKCGRRYLVIELKKGRSSDVVVGQILRYMGFIKNELAVNGESVRGIIIDKRVCNHGRAATQHVTHT